LILKAFSVFAHIIILQLQQNCSTSPEHLH